MSERPSSSTSKRTILWQSNEEDRIIRQKVLCSLIMLLIREQADRTHMHHGDNVCLSVANKLEYYFYQSANSREEYMDSRTLLQRVKTIGRDIWLKEITVRQQQRHL